MTWAPDYATSAELKSYLRIVDSVDDAQVSLALTAASRAVDRCAGRQFGQVAAAELRYYPLRYDRHRRAWIISIDDLQDVTGLVLGGSFSTATYTLEPRNAVVKGLAYTQLVIDPGTPWPLFQPGCSTTPDLAVTALWGWSALPVPVKQATLLQASRFLARRDSPYGVAGSPTDGSEVRLLASVDPDVRVSLGRYTRVWGAV